MRKRACRTEDFRSTFFRVGGGFVGDLTFSRRTDFVNSAGFPSLIRARLGDFTGKIASTCSYTRSTMADGPSFTVRVLLGDAVRSMMIPGLRAIRLRGLSMRFSG